MKIVKNSGNIVDFNRDKLQHSLLKSGADKRIVEDVLQKIDSKVYEGISSKNIYKLAFSLLKKSSNSYAARYNIRTAIQMLGPAGFFFEKYVGRLFSDEGYAVQINLKLNGKCVGHEVDLAIKKGDNVEMIECKFHGGQDAVSDVKVPMYILSRYNDLKINAHAIFSRHDKITNCWIVTNNRFSSDAISFANCSGLRLLSWDYPEKNNLKKRIYEDHLYPITCLTSLTIAEKDKLLVLDVILVREVLDNHLILEKIGLSSLRIKNVLKEASELCRYR